MAKRGGRGVGRTASGRVRSAGSLTRMLLRATPGSTQARQIEREISRRLSSETRRAPRVNTREIPGAEFMSRAELRAAGAGGGGRRRNPVATGLTFRERSNLGRVRNERRAEFFRRVG